MVAVAIIVILRPPSSPRPAAIIPIFSPFPHHFPTPLKGGRYPAISTHIFNYFWSTKIWQRFMRDSGKNATNKENKCQKLWSCVVFAPESFICSNFIFFILWFYFQAKSCKIYEKMESGNFQSLFLKLARLSTSKSLTNQVYFVLLAMVSWDGLVYACQLKSKTF